MPTAAASAADALADADGAAGPEAARRDLLALALPSELALAGDAGFFAVEAGFFAVEAVFFAGDAGFFAVGADSGLSAVVLAGVKLFGFGLPALLASVAEGAESVIEGTAGTAALAGRFETAAAGRDLPVDAEGDC